MQPTVPKGRIFGQSVAWDYEYQYLTNETFAGEEVAVQLLDVLAQKVRSIPKFYDEIKAQRDEELEHYELYARLLSEPAPRPHSGFDQRFKDYVLGLGTATEVAFCVQTIFETLSLGAIAWRIQTGAGGRKSTSLDRRIYSEEYCHTVLALPHLAQLQKLDGNLGASVFHKHMKAVSSIFSDTYRADNLAVVMLRQFNLKVSPEDLTTSSGYQAFKWANATLVSNAYRKYLSEYQACS